MTTLERDVFRAYLQVQKCWLNLCLNNERLRNYPADEKYVQEIYEKHIPKDGISFYFSHGSACQNDTEILNWQKDFQNKTNIHLVDPFKDDEEEKVKELSDPKIEKKRLEEIDFDIVMRDLCKIALTDATVVYLNGADSAGTHMEMPYAFKMGKRVYSIIENIPMRVHPWIFSHSTKVFKTLNAFDKYVLENLKELKIIYTKKVQEKK